MTNTYDYPHLGRFRTPPLRMFWTTVEGRLVCRWTNSDERFRQPESEHASVAIAS